jgi:hypothetical protein
MMPCKRAILTAFGVLGLLGALGSCPVFGAGWKTLPDHVPSAAKNISPTGRLPATNELRLAVGVPLRDPAGLDNFLAQVSDPASPNYRQFLTPEEFTARFGPTEADYAAVRNFAQTNGLKITATHGNRLVLDVSGPAAAVEKAFHFNLRTYRHPTEARDFFAPDAEPTVDASLPVADIQGLSDFSKPHPRLKKMAAANATSRGGSSPDGAGAYFGGDFRNAYLPGVTLTGAGQMVGLVQFDGFYASDITAYETAAGIAAIPIQTVLLDGYNGVPTTGANSGNGEVSLDIEMAMSMAPGLAKVMVFEAGPSGLQNDILNAMAASNTVKNLSCSWGWGGGPSTTTDNIFKTMAAQGQSFFNASGDSCAFTTGASSANGVDNTSLANAPSSSPYITQVGGTTLTTGTAAAYSSETVWNWGGGQGSSGGISSYYSIPSWQTNVSNLAGRGGSASFRNIPDVALTGDNVYVKYGNGSSGEFGGTSCAAPLWVAFLALVNQQATANGNAKGMGLINPAIYAIAAGSSYANCFHDVTTGNNFWSSSPSLFSATAGYDLCTGLGTPAGPLITALAGTSDSLAISPMSGAASGVAGGPFSVTAGNFLLTNTSSAALTWSLVSTSAWLKISATSGTLAAHIATNLTASLTATASNLAVGTYSANLIFSNAVSHVAQTGLFTLQVNQPLVVSPTNALATSGPVGGPFGVTSQNYLLINQGGSSLPWSLVNTSAWLSVSSSSGTLAGGAQTNVTISLTAAANSLASGVYSANVLVTNRTGVAASLSFTISVGQPILNNGGFETGDFTSWTETGTTTYMSVSTTASYVHSGTHGAELGPSGAVSYLSQNLVTTPGANYLLSCWLTNPKSGTPNQFLAQWNGVTIYNQTNLPALAWTNLQFLVTATGTSTALQFGFRNDPAYFGFDDVSVTPVAPLTFKSTARSAGNFQLVWNTTTGVVYQVQYKTNLLQANWLNLGGATTAVTNTLTITDTNAFQVSPQRYYRLSVLP